MSEQTNEELRAAIDTLTRDAARLTTERAFTDEEWRRDMADLRAQMDRARVEAASDYATLTRERDEARVSVNELAAQQQRLMGMIGAQTAEKVRLLTERDEAYTALRACARKCEHRCGEIATIRAGDDTQEGGAFRYCDNPACRRHETVLGDLPHAAALRAAGGGR